MSWWGLYRLEYGPAGFQRYFLKEWLWITWEAAVMLDRGLAAAGMGERIFDDAGGKLRRPGE
jgi:hypothetical protein